MHSMFQKCSSLESIDISNFNTPLLDDISSMFTGCSSLTSIDLSNFNSQKIKKVFHQCLAQRPF